jgi:hypothetical protein
MSSILTEMHGLVNLIDVHKNSILIEFILLGKTRVLEAAG